MLEYVDTLELHLLSKWKARNYPRWYLVLVVDAVELSCWRYVARLDLTFSEVVSANAALKEVPAFRFDSISQQSTERE